MSESNDNGGNATNQQPTDEGGHQDPGQQSVTPGPNVSPEVADQLRGRFQQLKAGRMNGTLSVSELQEFNELRDYLYAGAGIPETYREAAKDPAAPYDREGEAIAKAFKPALTTEDVKTPRAVLDGRMTAEQGEFVKDLAVTLGLPAEWADELGERLAHHFDMEGGEGGYQLVEDFGTADEVFGAFANHFSSREEAEEIHAKARFYVESVLSPAELQAFDNGIGRTTLALDPYLNRKLATLYDVAAGGEG